MKYTTYEKTGQQVSLLGFGNMRLPTVGDGDSIDFDAAKAMVDKAYAGGVNYFDTAYGYHGGESEAFVRKALADKPRDSYFLATKLPMWLVDKAEKALQLLDEQLQRLGTDYIDFYLFHNMLAENIETFEKFELYKLMDQKRKEGVIRNLGFSFHDTPEVLAKLACQGPWDFAQIQYNYFDADFTRAQEQYDILRQHEIPVIVMEPVRGGRLADLGPDGNKLLKDANPSASVASWGMRWVAEKHGVLTVLSGMSSLAQVEDNLNTFSNPDPLNDEEKRTLAKAAAIFKDYAMVPCTACRYCMPCPAGVDIPGMFAMYNEYCYDGSLFGLQSKYAGFPAEQNGGHCVSCKQCEEACPQRIPISDLMHKIHADGAGT